jgi:hypothetical protein
MLMVYVCRGTCVTLSDTHKENPAGTLHNIAQGGGGGGWGIGGVNIYIYMDIYIYPSRAGQAGVSILARVPELATVHKLL